MASVGEAREAAAVVRDAGGRIVGRTRLQKIAFLLEAAGLGAGFSFKYRRYGPFSDELADASRTAGIVGLISETEQAASWGGQYSTYICKLTPDPNVDPSRLRLAQEIVEADALELAAMALFLSRIGIADPWSETFRRKPEKAAAGRLERAKQPYSKLRQIKTPRPLPAI
jgi:uncharacterized protein